MEPKRDWQPGDCYWALWLNANRDSYFPHFEGEVASVRKGIIRFRQGGWRYVQEGLPFGSKGAAEQYANDKRPSENDSLTLYVDAVGNAAYFLSDPNASSASS